MLPRLIYPTAEKRRRGYSWDSRRGGYISLWTGKPVSEGTVRAAVRSGNEYLRSELNDITRKMMDGKISVSAWQKQVGETLKDGWATSMRVGAGPPISASARGKLGAALRQEYRYLDGFAQKLAAGNMTEAQILFRMDLYADAAMVPYWMGLSEAQAAAGNREAVRRLGASEHCPDCLDLADIWMPIDRITIPGTGTQCQRRCQCTLEFR